LPEFFGQVPGYFDELGMILFTHVFHQFDLKWSGGSDNPGFRGQFHG
jgi:hypothetical protein